MDNKLIDVPYKLLIYINRSLIGNMLLEEVDGSVNGTDFMERVKSHVASWCRNKNERVDELLTLFCSQERVDRRFAACNASMSNYCDSIYDGCSFASQFDYEDDIFDKDISVPSPLYHYLFSGLDEMVYRPLRGGADVSLKNIPAHFAARTETLNAELPPIVDINQLSSVGLTLLDITCWAGDRHVKAIEYVLENNADINLKTCGGNTVLHRVALWSNAQSFNKVCEKLLENGACVDTKNDRGETPYDLCQIDVNDEGGRTIKAALEKHIVKLKTAGFTVDISLNADSDLLKGLKAECVKELDKIKVTKINNSFSLNVVFTNVKNPWYLKNSDMLKNLEEKLNCVELLKDFPLYGHILRNTFKKTKQTFNLLDAAFTSFNSDKRKQVWSMKLPDLVKLKILFYLSNDDLQNFLESG